MIHLFHTKLYGLIMICNLNDESNGKMDKAFFVDDCLLHNMQCSRVQHARIFLLVTFWSATEAKKGTRNRELLYLIWV